jgi:hypothetical protein
LSGEQGLFADPKRRRGTRGKEERHKGRGKKQLGKDKKRESAAPADAAAKERNGYLGPAKRTSPGSL